MSLVANRAALLAASPPNGVAWNPVDKTAAINLTNSNLKMVMTASAPAAVRATQVRAAGKWYFEILFPVIAGSDAGGGFAGPGGTLATMIDIGTGFIQYRSGNVYFNNAVQFSNGVMSGGGVLKCAYDGTARLAWLKFESGNWNNNATFDPATGVGGKDVSALDGSGFYPLVGSNNSADTAIGRFKAADFTGSALSGYTAWAGT